MAEFFDSVDKNQDRLSEFHKRHLNDANTAYEKLFSNIEDIQDAISTLRSHISQSNTAAEVLILSKLDDPELTLRLGSNNNVKD